METTINLWLMVLPLSITGTAEISMTLNKYRFPKVFKTYELTFRVYLSIFHMLIMIPSNCAIGGSHQRLLVSSDGAQANALD